MADTNININIFAPFIGHEGGIISFVKRMDELNLSPSQVLDLYERYMDELQASMSLPPPEAPTAAPDPNVRRQSDSPDVEFRLGPCPRCGGEVWGIKKCPHISPPWRTFLACDAETCDYHGRSRLTVDELRRAWPDGVEEG